MSVSTIVLDPQLTLQFHLYRRYPVQHVDDKTPLPTLPYQWPDSQGDGAKFLQGQSNSERWEEQLGSIYRLWSGMNPEVYILSPFLFRSAILTGQCPHPP